MSASPWDLKGATLFLASPASNYVTGTILTDTGDQRYLAGQVHGDELYLSTFDGAHVFLYKAKVTPDGGLAGDVDPKVAEVAGALSPVPGGVGPVTTALLLRHVTDAAAAMR